MAAHPVPGPPILSDVLASWTARPRSETVWVVVVAVHALAVWFLVGMIWTVHLVHYPLFAEVGPAEYVDFQAEHVRRIGLVLAVPWLAEGVTTAALLLGVRARREVAVVILGAAAAAAVVLISGFASAPAHGDLADGFDAAVHDRLMAWNLARALLWTLKGGVAAMLLWWAISTRPSQASG